jgi:crotonobetaine/carnitine-CoA ligase
MLISSPLPPDPEAFMKRFGVGDIITAFGSTEVSGCFVRTGDIPIVKGSVGRLRPGYEVRLVDDHDIEVPEGEAGELLVRTDFPWALTTAYVANPEATAAAWRNGWFHTGDSLRRDSSGDYSFHDRLKDALRRRGENISSFEVERAVVAHPGVAEVACVAAASDHGVDDEVKVWIVPAGETEIEFAALAEFLVERLPHFMVPRYYEAVPELPKTETMRVKKHLLRERGNTAATWDLEAHGLRVTKSGLTKA